MTPPRNPVDILKELLAHGQWYTSAIKIDTYGPSNIDGEKLREEAEASLTHYGWVRSDTAPPRSGKYIVFAPSLDPNKLLIAMAWYTLGGGWSLLPLVWCNAITHWMKLPQPPEVEV